MSVAVKVFFLPMGSVLIRQHKSVRGNPSARPIPDRKFLFVSGAVVVWDKRSEGGWSSSQLKPRRFDARRKQSPTPSVDLRLGGGRSPITAVPLDTCVCAAAPASPPPYFYISLAKFFFPPYRYTLSLWKGFGGTLTLEAVILAKAFRRLSVGNSSA